MVVFTVANSYDKFMGRFSRHLARAFADRAGVTPGERALDVGCGPGALTEELVERLGVDQLEAIDPSPEFVAEVARRFPKLSVAQGSAEELPYDDAIFDATLSQLVVHFMTDPVLALTQMARVTRPGGRVAACVWALEPGSDSPLSVFHAAVEEIDPEWVAGQRRRPGTGRGQLADLFRAAGMPNVTEDLLAAEVPITSFEAYWAPFLLGAGPAGDYVRAMSFTEQVDLEDRARSRLPEGPFRMPVSAWCVVATV